MQPFVGGSMTEIRWGWVRWKPWLFFGRGLRFEGEGEGEEVRKPVGGSRATSPSEGTA